MQRSHSVGMYSTLLAAGLGSTGGCMHMACAQLQSTQHLHGHLLVQARGCRAIYPQLGHQRRVAWNGPITLPFPEAMAQL